MTRQQVENLDRTIWECLGCQQKEANPRPTASDQDEEPNYTIRKTKLSKVNIMQFNIDSLLSKLEELKMVLKEENIDIFLIQETKLVKSNKLPTIPGYTVKRQDRTQLVGKEMNRGGGLIFGFKKNIPFKRAYIEIRRDPDKFTEWMSFDIPLSSKKKLRLTNIYVPPKNSKEVNEDHFSPDEWPSKEYDMILGDVNAHSLLWDNNTSNGTSDTRAEKIEDWLASSGMACLNDGKRTHFNRSTGGEAAPDTSFVHSSLLDKVSWRTTKKLGSDHLPIIITYEDEMVKVNDRPRFKWRLSEADWKVTPTKWRRTSQRTLISLTSTTLKRSLESQSSNLRRSTLVRRRSTKEPSLG